MVFLTAAPGYGKTRLLDRWVAERRRAGHAAVLVTAKAVNSALVHAVERAATLLTGGNRVGPGTPLGRRSEPTLDGAVVRLIDLLDRCGPATVVLDLQGAHQPLDVVADLARACLDGPLRGLTLVIASRARPPAALAPLIVNGEVGHLDEQFLELRSDEVASVLGERVERPVPSPTVDRIAELAAGWPLGVVVLGAALDDPASTLDAALERLLDYMTVEVLDRCTTAQRRVLDVIALVERFAPELVEHLGDAGDVELPALLELRAASCFIRPGRSPGWMELHPLLRAAIRRSPHELEPGLRDHVLERAATWFVDEGHPIEAAWCYRRLGDWQRGGEVLISHLATILRTDQLDDLLDITTELPVPFQVAHLTWAMGIAWLEISTGRLPSGLARLAMLERHCDERSRIQLLALRAASAPFRHDPEPALLAAEEALELLAQTDPDDRYEDVFLVMQPAHFAAQLRANALVAGTYLGSWERVAALDVRLDPVTVSELAATTVYGICGRRATYRALAGDVARASADAEAARVLLEARSDIVITARNQLELAEAFALRSRGRGDRAAEVLDAMAPLPPSSPNRHAWLAAQRADLACDSGEPARALDLVGHALDGSTVPPAPLLRSLLASAGARAKLLQHDPDGAEELLAHAPPSFYRRWWLVLAQLARAQPEAAAELVEEWPDEPAPGSRTRRLLARAAIFEQRGTPAEADDAFALVVPHLVRHHLVLPLQELGAVGSVLVGRADRSVPAVAELARLLPRGTVAPADDLLSPAEARVMAHLAQQLTLREIADRLHLSVNTVKSHARRIYRKLDARGRDEAIERWMQSGRA